MVKEKKAQFVLLLGSMNSFFPKKCFYKSLKNINKHTLVLNSIGERSLNSSWGPKPQYHPLNMLTTLTTDGDGQSCIYT